MTETQFTKPEFTSPEVPKLSTKAREIDTTESVQTEAKFTKPEFQKPQVPKIPTKAGEIDITESMQSEAIDKLTAVIGLKHLKHFYDGLAKSMEDYSDAINTNIVTPLSSTVAQIGTKTDGIDAQIDMIEAQIEVLQNSMPEIAG